MTNEQIQARAERIIAEMKIKHGGNDSYAPVMLWSEFLSLLAEREADKEEIAEQVKRIADLEARPVAPINFSESADADYCREWAWNETKKELNTEHWKAEDNGNFYGFFLTGWHARLQFNEQRRAENLKIAKDAGLARTLTVKLPLMLSGSPHFNGGVKSMFKVFKQACDEQGITLIVGGEDAQG
jgi:hypothetical protein